jgi:hypothetical protein
MKKVYGGGRAGGEINKMAEQKMSKLSFHKSSDLFIYLFICGTGI